MTNKFKGEYSGTKDVSERHQIQQNDLQNYLNEKLEGFEQISSIEEFIGGQSNPTYLIKTYCCFKQNKCSCAKSLSAL